MFSVLLVANTLQVDGYLRHTFQISPGRCSHHPSQDGTPLMAHLFSKYSLVTRDCPFYSLASCSGKFKVKSERLELPAINSWTSNLTLWPSFRNRTLLVVTIVGHCEIIKTTLIFCMNPCRLSFQITYSHFNYNDVLIIFNSKNKIKHRN